MNVVSTTRIASCAGSLPNNLILEVIHSKNRVHQKLEVMTGGGVTMKANAA
jgi:hypothetical protein